MQVIFCTNFLFLRHSEIGRSPIHMMKEKRIRMKKRKSLRRKNHFGIFFEKINIRISEALVEEP